MLVFFVGVVQDDSNRPVPVPGDPYTFAEPGGIALAPNTLHQRAASTILPGRVNHLPPSRAHTVSLAAGMTGLTITAPAAVAATTTTAGVSTTLPTLPPAPPGIVLVARWWPHR